LAAGRHEERPVQRDFDGRIELGLQAARRAGEVLARHHAAPRTFERKGEVDLVTAADREAEEVLRALLLGAHPGDGFLGEEGGRADCESGWLWIVDPLDGTTNFVHRYPMFAVSIGLVHDGVPAFGCVHAPALGETFHAVRGGGAFLDGRPIGVSAVERVAESLLASGFPYNRREIVDELLARLRRVLMAGHGFRREGAAALDLCWVACGRLDGFWEQGLHAWDVAAGTLIVEEAGGRVTGFDGGPHDLFAGSTVASNGRIHDELRRLLFG
jgi:myo-inositol-1(or 4)-monophosphatase